jgi:murein DD-endopeptidase MepM/ murein hydrolase activator NlpD
VDHWADSDKDGSHFNYLVILHDDGTFAFYAHLKQYGFVVDVGDQVARGQVIGASGESGTPTLCAAFAECAVLHFGVYRRSWAVDLPIEFGNADGPLDARGGLQAGAFYTALPY